MIDEKKLIEVLEDYKNDEWNKSLYSPLPSVVDDCINFIEEQPKIGEWIPCSERLPEEHDSMFAEFKGTDKWDNAMFEKISDDVNVTVEFEDGKKKSRTLHTVDGKWKPDSILKCKVIAWQPLPEPYQSKGGKECDENATD